MVFTASKFDGHYLSGCAVVSAATATEAAARLNAELRDHGLPGNVKPEDLEPFEDDAGSVRMLSDGNY